MKPKFSNFSIVVIFMLITSTPSNCQDWNWQWAESMTKQGDFAWMVVQSCDLMNNIYCVAPYDIALYLPDTVFIHPEQWQQTNTNNAVLKYNDRGEFIDALDLYTLPGELIIYTKVGTDQDLNIYFTCSFSMRIFVQDTIINHCNSPYPYLGDGLVVKLTPEYEIVWAKLVGGLYQDDIFDSFVTENGDLYILSHNVSDQGNQIIFFEQDTVYSDVDLNSISKLDTDGNMLWRKDFYGMISAYRLTKGNDGLIYYWGAAYTDIVLDNDTIINPHSPELGNSSFCAVINENGTVEQISFLDYGVFAYQMVVNSSGDRFISSSISGTVIIMQDTIIIPENEFYGFVGKYNSQLEPEWYYIIPTFGNQSLGLMQLALDGENLIFGITSNDDLHVADTVIPINPGEEAFVGEFDSNGELINIIHSDASIELVSDGLVLDNCNNPVISGHFKGVAYVGPDTLHSFINTVEDGYLAKLQRNEPYSINVGKDTLACAEYTLYGPPGYLYYSWNDSITYQSWYTVTETESVPFACANVDGCWHYDTVNVAIHPGYSIDLGPDTAIHQNETIIFTVPQEYESYLWSNSVTANTITIFGESYEPGTILPVWVRVTDGPCIVYDTVYVTIKSEFGVEDLAEKSISLYPNPFNDFLYFKTDSEIERIEICDLQGLTTISKDIQNPTGEKIKINLEDLKQGVYILKLLSGESEIIKKIVKL
jgi:hypothetical protein